MDITYTSEWDAKRYERVIDASLRVTGLFRTSFFGWCMTVCGLLCLCIDWMHGGRLEGWNWALLVVVLLPFYSFLMRRLQTRQFMKALHRLRGDENHYIGFAICTNVGEHDVISAKDKKNVLL